MRNIKPSAPRLDTVQGTDGTTVDNYWYWPCGLIATSVFNDGIFYNPCPSGKCDNTEAWSESDIAWSSDLSQVQAQITSSWHARSLINLAPPNPRKAEQM